MFTRWRAALERKGFNASEEHGWDLRRVQLVDGDLADYFTKIARRSPARTARKSAPRCRDPDAAPGRRGRHRRRVGHRAGGGSEQASEGRRQLTWSTGRRDLRKLAGLVAEATDEDIAAEELDADTHLGLPDDTARWLSRRRVASRMDGLFGEGG